MDEPWDNAQLLSANQELMEQCLGLQSLVLDLEAEQAELPNFAELGAELDDMRDLLTLKDEEAEDMAVLYEAMEFERNEAIAALDEYKTAFQGTSVSLLYSRLLELQKMQTDMAAVKEQAERDQRKRAVAEKNLALHHERAAHDQQLLMDRVLELEALNADYVKKEAEGTGQKRKNSVILLQEASDWFAKSAANAKAEVDLEVRLSLLEEELASAHKQVADLNELRKKDKRKLAAMNKELETSSKEMEKSRREVAARQKHRASMFPGSKLQVLVSSRDASPRGSTSSSGRPSVDTDTASADTSSTDAPKRDRGSLSIAINRNRGKSSGWGAAKKKSSKDSLKPEKMPVVDLAKELQDLREKIKDAPPEWTLPASATLQGYEAVYFFQDGIGPVREDEEKPPPRHKGKSSEGETLRGFLFADELLLCCWNYKFKKIVRLPDIAISRRFELCIFFYPKAMPNLADFLDFSKQTTLKIDGTVLQCPTQGRRDFFAKQIETAIAQHVAKKVTAVSPRSRLPVPRTLNMDVPQGRDRKKTYFDPPPEAEDGAAMPGKITICLRGRPLLLPQEKQLEQVCLTFDGTWATLDQSSMESWMKDRKAHYDAICGPDDNQESVFNAVGPGVLAGVAAGHGAAVLCYGNTGAGKTYTMFGEPSDPGLVPRILDAVFAHTKTDAVQSAIIKLSFIQIYNGKVQDLQDAQLPELQLRLLDTTCVISDKLITPVTSTAAAMDIIHRGNELRSNRKHNMNEISSRSHAIVILDIALTMPDDRVVCSSLYMVDLAGSENASQTGVDGAGKKEAIFINKSLISLGRVVKAVHDNTQRLKKDLPPRPVPFRDSKLTQVLFPVLTGSYVCTMMLNVSISPAMQQARQTAKTMSFGEGLRHLARQRRKKGTKATRKKKTRGD